MKRKSGAALFGFALGAAMLSGVAAQAAGEVIISRQIDADRYDPHISTARGAVEVLFMAGDTLVGLDYDMKTIVPMLAKEWKVSEDGLVYTFKLRDDVTFCDGKKFTAAAVKGSVERWLNLPKGVTKWRAGPVDQVIAVDDYTVEYKLKKPYSELLFQMTQHNHTIIDPEQAQKLGDDFGVKGFNGTGPYCFDSWEPRNQLVLKKHAAYKWAPPIYPDGKPKLDKIVWKIVPEESTRVAALETGQTDATQYLPWWSVPQFQANPKFKTSKAEAYFWTFYVGMKITREALQDVRVRKAINLAVDQKAIADAVWFGLAEPASSYIAPGVIDFDQNQNLADFGEDVKRAEKLLDEAGWKKGPDGFRYKDGKKLAPIGYGIANTQASDVFQSIQGDLRKVGIDLQIQLFDSTVAWGKLATQEFDMFAMSYPYVSAGDALNLYFRSANVPTPNRVNWKDPETDAWLEEGSTALTDKDRAAAFAKVQRKVHEAALWIPIVHEPLFVVTGPKLKPVRAHGIYGCAFYKGLGLELR